ncbi:ORF6N domain-containing protein [Variovorax paradoxus]|nr:ORF6N domain-containing protein [Variovorax paradoxus]
MADAPAVLDVSVVAALRDAEGKIYVLRGLKVMLAQDLAALYGVETRVLLQAMRRNLDRFPADFAFTLENHDLENLRSQLVISKPEKPEKPGSGGARYRSVAFTEQGVAMLSSVLRSERAVAVNIEIMRTFVKLRSMLSEHADLKRKLNALEQRYDQNFRDVFNAIHQLMDEPKPGAYSGRGIGFTKDK